MSTPVFISSNFRELSRELFINQGLYSYGYDVKPVDIETLNFSDFKSFYNIQEPLKPIESSKKINKASV